jgi:hypothetical protein
LSAQQQTTIQQSVLRANNAPRVEVNSVNFTVNTGVVIPSHVHVATVSAFPALIDVFPRYRDYSFFVVEDEIVFLDSGRRVVEVVPVGPRTRFSGRGSGDTAAVALNLNQAEIREIQLVLIQRGLLTGEADGVLGSRTHEALITFQRQQGLQTTGSIDTRTVAALGLSNRVGQQGSQGTSVNQSATTGQQPGVQQGTTPSSAGQATAPQSQPATTQGQPAPAQGQAGTQPPAGQPNTTTGQAPQTANQPSSNQVGQGAQTAAPPPAATPQGQKQPTK